MMTIILSFDDGRYDNITNVVPVLENLQLPATFNITTGYIDGSLADSRIFCENRAMGLGDLKRIRSNPLFEIASHGDQHINDPKDIIASIEKLRNWNLIDKKIGFASPNHRMEYINVEKLEALRIHLKLDYIRIGGGLKKNIVEKGKRTLSYLTQDKKIYLQSYKFCAMDYLPSNSIFKCLPYNKKMNLEQIEYLIKYAENRNMILIILLHSVIKRGEPFFDNIENMDYNSFCRLCGFINEEKNKGNLLPKRTIDLSI